MILQDKSILITGGTGSLGKTLVRRILTNELEAEYRFGGHIVRDETLGELRQRYSVLTDVPRSPNGEERK